jgi:hypothetical protein
MHHGAKTGLGNKPFAAFLDGEVNGLLRAKIHTHPAAFTVDFIDGVCFSATIHVNRIKSAAFLTLAACRALVCVDDGHIATHEISAFLNCGIHEQVQVCCVHICVTQHALLCYRSKGCSQTGFSGAALAALYDVFFHALHFPMVLITITFRSMPRAEHALPFADS